MDPPARRGCTLTRARTRARAGGDHEPAARHQPGERSLRGPGRRRGRKGKGGRGSRREIVGWRGRLRQEHCHGRALPAERLPAGGSLWKACGPGPCDAIPAPLPGPPRYTCETSAAVAAGLRAVSRVARRVSGVLGGGRAWHHREGPRGLHVPRRQISLCLFAARERTERTARERTARAPTDPAEAGADSACAASLFSGACIAACSSLCIAASSSLFSAQQHARKGLLLSV